MSEKVQGRGNGVESMRRREEGREREGGNEEGKRKRRYVVTLCTLQTPREGILPLACRQRIPQPPILA